MPGEPKAWNPVKELFEFAVVIKQPIKWSDNPANFGAVFSGSNDRGAVQNQQNIIEHIKVVSKYQPITFMSVVGGCYFLDLALEFPTSRIVLFDSNVAEFTKLSTVLNIMSKNHSVNPFKEMENLLEEDHTFLMPYSPLGQVTWSLDRNFRSWKFEGREENPFPFILTSGLFPEYKLNINSEQRKELLEILRANLDLNVHLDFPSIDANGNLIVVFCSNANPDELSLEYLRSKISNSAGIIPIRAVGYGGYELENLEALDPHLYWEIVARSCLVGRSHQVWSPEDSEIIGSSYDSTTDSSSVLNRDTLVPVGTHSLLLHIIFGKSRSLHEDRLLLFEGLVYSLSLEVKRIVIADWPPEGGLPQNSKFVTTESFIQYCKDSLLGFSHIETRFAPGAGNLQRNMFLIFERN